MIIHLGYPKCASTTLQGYFDQCGDGFIGCNPKRPYPGFYNKDWGYFFENILRFGSDEQFDAGFAEVNEKLKALDKWYQGQAILSFENTNFRKIPWDLPSDIKLKRMGRFSDDQTTLMVIYRPVTDFILSFYKNHLGFGYTGSLDEFLEELSILAPYGFIDDLDLARLHRRIKASFKAQKIIYADLSVEGCFEKLWAHTGLPAIDFEQGKVQNAGMKDSDIPAALAYNRQNPNRKKLMDWFEGHRVMPDADWDDADKFWISRNRHAQADYIAAHQGESWTREAIQWPEPILKLEIDNQAFITALESEQGVTCLHL